MAVVTALHCVSDEGETPGGDQVHDVFFPQNGGYAATIVGWDYPGLPWDEVGSNDIAILHLSAPVPRWIAEPTPVLTTVEVSGVFQNNSPGFIVGSGGTVVYDQSTGMGKRRVGRVYPTWRGADPCNELDLCEGYCDDNPVWQANHLDPQQETLWAKGDSGGGLFGISPSAMAYRLVGVISGAFTMEPNQCDFFEKLEVASATGAVSEDLQQWFYTATAYFPPDEPTPPFSLAELALYSTSTLSINDRVVVRVGEQGPPAMVAAAGMGGIDFYGWDLGLGVEASVGNVWCNDNVRLGDRSKAGNIVAEGRLVRGNSIQVGSVTEHGHTGMPAITLAPWAPTVSQPGLAVTGTVNFDNQGQHALLTGQTSIKSGGTLNLYPSTAPYYFEDLIVEPQGRLVVNTNGQPQRIYVQRNLIFRGQLVDTDTTVKADTLVAFYGTNDVNIQSPIAATIAAPTARLILDAAGQHFRGGFYARGVTVHQDIRIHHIPFLAPW